MEQARRTEVFDDCFIPVQSNASLPPSCLCDCVGKLSIIPGMKFENRTYIKRGLTILCRTLPGVSCILNQNMPYRSSFLLCCPAIL